MCKCPYCHEKTVSLASKLALLKPINIKCKKCGGILKLSLWYIPITLILILIFFLGQKLVETYKQSSITLIYFSAFIIIFIIIISFVPLKRVKGDGSKTKKE